MLELVVCWLALEMLFSSHVSVILAQVLWDFTHCCWLSVIFQMWIWPLHDWLFCGALGLPLLS